MASSQVGLIQSFDLGLTHWL